MRVDVVLYGDIPPHIVGMARRAALITCEQMEYNGPMPELHISEGYIDIPDGRCFSVYNKKDRHVRVGYKVAAQHYHGTGDAEEIMMAYCAAHEMTHHIQQERGYVAYVPLMPDNHAAYYAHPTEAEAHAMGNKALELIFGFTLQWVTKH
jgi:hypothetical protein